MSPKTTFESLWKDELEKWDFERDLLQRGGTTQATCCGGLPLVNGRCQVCGEKVE